MNYVKIYNSLIEKGRIRKLDGYKEKHHIIPRCLGGSNESSNLVDLTPEEHYLAHQLLVKIHPGNHKLIRAAVMMIPNRKSNKLYGWLRKRFSEAQSNLQSKEGNSQFGSRWVHNKETKEIKKIKGDIESGWDFGRKLSEQKKSISISCKFCQHDFSPKAFEIFCSLKCKKYFKSPASKIIDENIETVIDVFTQTKSITATLKQFGINGAREGNAHLSGILKNEE